MISFNKWLRSPRILAGLPLIVCCYVDSAMASSGISQLTTGPEKVMNTITGSGGRIASIVAIACCGLYYIWRRDDMSEGFKILLGVVFAISFIAFAVNIVDSVFSFSGALI